MVSARDAAGASWASDAILDVEFDAGGYLVFARYADGSVWVAADGDPEVAELISELRDQMQPPGEPPRNGSRDAPAQWGPDLLDRPRRALVDVTRRRVSSSQAALAKLLVATQPGLRRSSYPRVLTHGMVLGAVVVPMSMGVASAQTSPVDQTRLTVSYSLDPSPSLVTTADALRLAAATDSAPSPPTAAPAPPAAPAAVKPAAPTPRPIKSVAPAPGAIGKFSWGWCTWWVASKRTIAWSGNAIEWWPNAAAAGFAEGQTARVGAVMVTRESGYGHVAYVESVDANGGFTVSEMNFVGFGVVSQRHFTSNPSVLVGFIY